MSSTQRRKIPKENRIKAASELYEGKYSYEKTDFSKVKRNTTVQCPIHGDFLTNFDNHFHKKCGCPYCYWKTYDTPSFIENAKAVHGDKYDYSNTHYIKSHEKVTITCPIHGEFTQTPNAHLSGQGCPQCVIPSKLEDTVRHILAPTKHLVVEQYKPSFLKPYSLDFFLPHINVAIECQGKQHFGEGGWTPDFKFQEQAQRDQDKFNICLEHNIEIIYFAERKYTINEYFGKIFSDTNELLKYIEYLYIKAQEESPIHIDTTPEPHVT